VRIGRGKDTFYAYPRINLLCKTGKLRTVHFPADIFSQAPLQPGFLCRTGRYGKDDLIIPFIDFIPHDQSPGKMTECPDKTR
jgi:hypothetical protein